MLNLIKNSHLNQYATPVISIITFNPAVPTAENCKQWQQHGTTIPGRQFKKAKKKK